MENCLSQIVESCYTHSKRIETCTLFMEEKLTVMNNKRIEKKKELLSQYVKKKVGNVKSLIKIMWKDP